MNCCNSEIDAGRRVDGSCRRCRGTAAGPRAACPGSDGPGGCARGRGPGCERIVIMT